MKEHGSSKFNRKTGKIEYSITEKERGKPKRIIVFNTQQEYLKECCKRSFILSSNPEENARIYKEILRVGE